MPKKTVLEMSRLERLHYSLRGKTLRAIVIFFLIISVAAAAFGFGLYRASESRETRLRTWQNSRAAAGLADQDEIRREADIVTAVYDSLSEEERQQNASDEARYTALYDEVRGEEFEALRKQLQKMMEATDSVAVYTAVLDTEQNRLIFLADADPKDSFCPPGSWDAMEPEYIDAFLNGAETGLLDSFYGVGSMSAVISNMEQYGYRCTAGTRLFDVNGYPVFLFFDTDMNRVASASRVFLLHYALLILIIMIMILALAIRSMGKQVVDPINELTDAARKYIRDTRTEHRTGKYFESLNIRTGDEIENLSITMKLMEEEIAEYVRNLTAVTAEKERINTELSVGSQIQDSMVPHIFPAFPERKEFRIYASMDTAKEVGGDFYDFFLIDEDHLCLIVADVSGKGIPAALFMMATKILLNTYVVNNKVSPAEILQNVNHAICRNNPANMFVTVWLGILDIRSGRLTAASAGHEYPAIRRSGTGAKAQESPGAALAAADGRAPEAAGAGGTAGEMSRNITDPGDAENRQNVGTYELYRDQHGLVLGGMDGMAYRDYELTLEPGDSIFQYTDGVTEAMNEQHQLFGKERMLEALNREPGAGPEKILANVREAVDAFAGDMEQSDDITMLCLQYRGPDDREDTEKGFGEPDGNAGIREPDAVEAGRVESEAPDTDAEGSPESEALAALTGETVEFGTPADLEKLPEVLSFVEQQLETTGCPLKSRMQIAVAVEELFVNIASYAYGEEPGDVVIRMETENNPDAVRITFIDNGKPYDPLSREDPDVTASAEDRPIGGLGVYMVKKTMDDVRYEYRDGQNMLTIRKMFS